MENPSLLDFPVLDPSFIERLKAFDPENKRGLVRRLVSLYLESTPNVLDDLRRFVADAESESLRKEAHRFKTSNANLGLMRMSQLMRTLEENSSDRELVAKLMADIERESQDAMKTIQGYAN